MKVARPDNGGGDPGLAEQPRQRQLPGAIATVDGQVLELGQLRPALGRRFDEETKALKKNGKKLIEDWSEAAQERFEEGKEKLSEMLHS